MNMMKMAIGSHGFVPLAANCAVFRSSVFKLLTGVQGPRCRHDENNIKRVSQTCPCGKSASPPHVLTD